MNHSASTLPHPSKLIRAWPLALCLGFAACQFAAGADTCQVVEGGRIRGRDLAAAIPALGGLDPDAVIAPSPLAGVQRVFHPEEITRIAREHSLPPPERPLTTCFVRKTILLTAERLAPVIEKALHPPVQPTSANAGSPPGPAPNFEILDFSRYPIPEGTLSFPRPALMPSGMWRGQVVTPEGGNVAIWVRVRLIDPVSGAPLALGPTPEIRDVNRGDPVRVEVSFGRAVIAFDSVAESSGRKGEMVLVKTPDKSRRLLARVEDKGKVAIRK